MSQRSPYLLGGEAHRDAQLEEPSLPSNLRLSSTLLCTYAGLLAAKLQTGLFDAPQTAHWNVCTRLTNELKIKREQCWFRQSMPLEPGGTVDYLLDLPDDSFYLVRPSR